MGQGRLVKSLYAVDYKNFIDDVLKKVMLRKCHQNSLIGKRDRYGTYLTTVFTINKRAELCLNALHHAKAHLSTGNSSKVLT